MLSKKIDLDWNKLSYLRILYSIRLLKQLNEFILVINTNEVNFFLSVKVEDLGLKYTLIKIFSQKYSWEI